ncbi:uncharacterized protein BKA78DRAFT_4413 [Phyllosticta capitalensis]|uniref:uncharacterized protein n=1 Tax=Phyllosticta capitalensis TaxID=121624 RepID=UPI0031324B46
MSTEMRQKPPTCVSQADSTAGVAWESGAWCREEFLVSDFATPQVIEEPPSGRWYDSITTALRDKPTESCNGEARAKTAGWASRQQKERQCTCPLPPGKKEKRLKSTHRGHGMGVEEYEQEQLRCEKGWGMSLPCIPFSLFGSIPVIPTHGRR